MEVATTNLQRESGENGELQMPEALRCQLHMHTVVDDAWEA